MFAFYDLQFSFTLPTHEQATRKVIVGRGETEFEKEILASLVRVTILFIFSYFPNYLDLKKTLRG